MSKHNKLKHLITFGEKLRYRFEHPRFLESEGDVQIEQPHQDTLPKDRSISRSH